MRRLVVSMLLLSAALGAAAESWPLSNFELRTAEGTQRASSVAAGGSGFLAVWVDHRTDPNVELRATLLDHEGRVIEPKGLLLHAGTTPYEIHIDKSPVIWTGARWVVLFTTRAGLMTVSVSPDGTLDEPARLVASSDITPVYQLTALLIGNRVFIAGIAARGAAHMVLDESGKLAAYPHLVARSAIGTSLHSVLAASRGDEVLVVESSHPACASCPALVAHRIRSDGTELEQFPLFDSSQPTYYSYAIASHGNGYLLVGQNQDAGSVEMWILSADAKSVRLRGVIAPATPPPYVSGPIVLQPGQGRTDVFFLYPQSEGGRTLHRSTVSDTGQITPIASFPLELDEYGKFGLAVTPGRVVATMTRWNSFPQTDRSDIVARSSPTLDALPDAVAYHLAFSAPEQREARAVPRGEETLVTWVERRDPRGPLLVFAQRLGDDGRPGSSPPVSLFEESDYAIATDGLEYLVATTSERSIEVRHLRSDLTWREPGWTTIVTDSCGPLGKRNLTWDGSGWWLAWTSCTSGRIVVQRMDRELRPVIGTVELGEPFQAVSIHLLPVENAIVAFWTGGGYGGCNITCGPPLYKLFGARIGAGGTVLNPPAQIVDFVLDESIAFASRGSEVLAIWSNGGPPFGTRITPELVALDVVQDGQYLVGELLEDAALDRVDVGWDGERWIAASTTYDYNAAGAYRSSWRRFPPNGVLAVLWQSAAARQLESKPGNTGVVVAAAAGYQTLLLEPRSNDDTTSVHRYYVQNLNEPPRRRSVRR